MCSVRLARIARIEQGDVGPDIEVFVAHLPQEHEAHAAVEGCDAQHLDPGFANEAVGDERAGASLGRGHDHEGVVLDVGPEESELPPVHTLPEVAPMLDGHQAPPPWVGSSSSPGWGGRMSSLPLTGNAVSSML